MTRAEPVSRIYANPTFGACCVKMRFLVLPYLSLLFAPGESLSAAFTQNRLFRPECVSAGILMLTYLSTLRSKSRRFLFRTKNAYFANSPNTSHRLHFAAASLRKATPRPAFDHEQRKAVNTKKQRCLMAVGEQTIFVSHLTGMRYLAEAESHSKRKSAVAFTRRGGRSPE